MLFRSETINYLDNVEFIVYVEDGNEEEFQSWIVDLTNDNATITKKDAKYIEIDVETTKEG